MNNNRWRETLLTVILIVGGVTLTLYPIVYFLRGNYIFGLIELSCASLLWVSLYQVRKNHQYEWPARLAWFGVVVVLSFLFISGGVAGTGMLWWGLLPLVSYILFGRKQGTLLVVISMLTFLALYGASRFKVFNLFFSIDQIVQGIITVIVSSLIIYFYERIAGEAREQTIEYSRQLEEQAKLRKDVEIQLIENLQRLEKDKERETKVRSAMLNLLEDSRELENELKKEKESVEAKVVERTFELSQAKAKLDSSIENLPLGFLMVDVKETLIVTNPLARSFLKGKTEKENLFNLKTILNEKIDLNEYVRQCGKQKQRQELSDIEKDGRFFQFLLSPIITGEKNDVCIGVVVLIQDITEAKILDRSKDEFFSIASHELRTPLTAIRGNTSMILEYYADAIKDPELKAMVDDIHESSIRLINIVNDFLNVSRLEQGRMVYDLSEVDLQQLIPDTIKEYDVTGSRKKIGIEYHKSKKSAPLVRGDKDKIRQVLINLLGNSLKFTAKGSVTITTETVGKKVKVLVSDTGRGIPLKQQSLLFYKFQQAGSSLFTRDTAGGSGLGLYISRMMVEGMGGELILEHSAPGKGSTFSFSIPIATKENKVDRLAEIGLSEKPKVDNLKS